MFSSTSPPSRAAWIEIYDTYEKVKKVESPPSRAAWIEMSSGALADAAGVSPPSRAAWIEILIQLAENPGGGVAAFTGGVD